MKGLGILSVFKLHYEDVQGTPKAKRHKPKKNKKSVAKNVLDNNIFTRFGHHISNIQYGKTDRTAVLSNIDDRTPLPKLPQADKKPASNKSRKDLV